MSLIQSVILGLIQGFTEFLPVSSSGHLVVLPKIFGWSDQPLVFDTTVHLGTAFALIVYFYNDILEILKKDRSFGIKILVGSLPAALLGLLLDTLIETNARSIFSVIFFLALGSLLMIFAEERFRAPFRAVVTIKKSIIIGFFQALALFPGISRSGATISGSMLLGLRHRDAARFSFLLSIPIVLGAGAYKLLQVYSSGACFDFSLVVGFISSFLAGLLAISFMMNFLKNNRLYTFIAYRLLLITVLILIAF